MRRRSAANPSIALRTRPYAGPSLVFFALALHMPFDPQLRTLDLDLPSQPEPLLRLSLLMAEDQTNMAALSALIESDMALAAAVLKAVNSSLYGLSGRAQTVQQAITYLGTREVAGIVLEIGLRAVFPPTAELQAMWQRAAQRSLVMGRLAASLQMDAWAAHSAGLFEECGKAVLFRHAPDHYRSVLRAASDDVELVELETAAFGVSHDALGAALCESWGLSADAVVSVRHHVAAQAELEVPQALNRRSILALSVVAASMVRDADEAFDERVVRIAPLCDVDTHGLLRAARRVQTQLAQAAAHGR